MSKPVLSVEALQEREAIAAWLEATKFQAFSDDPERDRIRNALQRSFIQTLAASIRKGHHLKP